jgi:hypothetical protein
MLKKSLIFGSIVLLIVMLFALAGCEGPVGPAGRNGEIPTIPDPIPGTPGTPGSTSLALPNVEPRDLLGAFRDGNVTLTSSVQTVYGVVPAGYELKVMGKNTRVLAGYSLDVQKDATLTIWEEASLEADGVGSGFLTPNVGAIIQQVGTETTGKGTLVLPYDLDDQFEKGFHYKSPEVQNIGNLYVGSTSAGGDAPLALTPTNIARIFENENAIAVQNVAGLEPEAIPQDKKLTLVGNANTITTTSFTLGASGAELIVADGAVLTASNGTLTTSLGGTITNKGTIVLDSTGIILEGTGEVINNGRITTSTATSGDLVSLLALEGTGRIESAGAITLTAAPTLNQNLYIVGLSSVTLVDALAPILDVTPGREITIVTGSSLHLGSTSLGVDAPVNNSGTITTTTISTDVLKTIFGEMKNKGAVTASGAIVALASELTIPSEVELTLSGASTFATGNTNLIVNGKLILGTSADLVPLGDVTINGTLDLGTGGSLTIAAGKALKIESVDSITGTTGTLLPPSANAHFITIGGLEDYGITNATTGVTGANFKAAVNAILTARAKMEETVTASSSYGANVAAVIGTVEVEVILPVPGSSPFGSGLIHFGADALATGICTVPDNITISDSGTSDEGFEGTGDFIGGANDFTIGVNSSNQLVIFDGPFTGTTNKWGTISFNNVRFIHSNLLSPITPKFWVGVKSQR